jgi:hypothetical protein
MQNDPIEFDAGDVNLYRYLGNEPLNSTDPTGFADLPGWLTKLIDIEGGAGERGTITKVKDFYYDRNYPGGAHYDVHFIDEKGNPRKQRFWRDGTPFTEAENESITTRQRRNRRGGSINNTALATIGITSIIIGGAEAIYDIYLEKGEEGALKKVEAAFGCRLIRTILHNGEIPEVYDEYGVVRQSTFVLIMKGKQVRVFLEMLPGGGRGIQTVSNGEVLIKKCDCPLSGG